MIPASPSNRQHVWPAPGVTPIDPRTMRPLPAEGRTVRLDAYWRARIAEGSVVLTDPSAPAEKQKPKPKATKPDAQES